jgi:hypothetical protein
MSRKMEKWETSVGADGQTHAQFVSGDPASVLDAMSRSRGLPNCAQMAAFSASKFES